jgi:hypothetical protein
MVFLNSEFPMPISYRNTSQWIKLEKARDASYSQQAFFAFLFMPIRFVDKPLSPALSPLCGAREKTLNCHATG